jgi:hypothetical protein
VQSVNNEPFSKGTFGRLKSSSSFGDDTKITRAILKAIIVVCGDNDVYFCIDSAFSSSER